MLPSTSADDCDDCTPAYLRQTGRGIVHTAFSSLPFAITFLLVGLVVLRKVFPLLESSTSRSSSNNITTPSTSSFKTWIPTRGADSDVSRPSARRISALTFSTTIALSTVLTELLLCEISDSFDHTARNVALQITVSSLLVLLVVAIPLLELYSIISNAGYRFAGQEKGRLRLAWVLEIVGYGIFLFGFWLLGRLLPGTHTFGPVLDRETHRSLIEACLERVGVTGISLMALLSGFASVSSIWQSFGAKPRRVTDADIARKQAGLDATNEMLAAKRSRLRALDRKLSGAPSEKSFWQRTIGSIRGDADSQERKNLESEISGLETMSSTLSSTLSILRSRRQSQERATTPYGRTCLAFSYLFSCYCVYRIFTTSIATLRRYWVPKSTLAGSDPITNVLALIAKHIYPSLDQQAWSRQISFLLSGLILLASFSAVLQTFHLFARFTPSVLYAAQANLALLVGQVCGMYVISSALLLRSVMPSEVGSVINEALGTGVLESGFVDRWFEGWFLASVILTGQGIWIGRKVVGGSEGWDDDYLDDGDVEMGKRS